MKSHNLKQWFKNRFVRQSEQASAVDILKERVAYAVESLLENEALTANLDDAAAVVLLEWGTACVNMIVQDTRGLDDLAAGEVMAPRLRATRRLMRLVNRWVPKRSEMTIEDAVALLTQIVERALLVYGTEFALPDEAQGDTFLQSSRAASPVQAIERLRLLIENLVKSLNEAESNG